MLAIHTSAFRGTAGKSLGFTLCTLTSNVGGKGSLPGKAKGRFHGLQHPENPRSPCLLCREGRTSALSQPLQIPFAASPWRGGATKARHFHPTCRPPLPLRGETQPSVWGGGELGLGKQLRSPELFPNLWSSSTGRDDCC